MTKNVLILFAFSDFMTLLIGHMRLALFDKEYGWPN